MEDLGQFIKEYWGAIMFVIGIVFHAIWTYFRVGELEKHLVSYKEDTDKKIDAITKEKTILLEEISALKEEMASMNAKLDILVEGYKRK